MTLSLNGKPTLFEIDTGADVTVISQRIHEEIGSPFLNPPQRTLWGPCNQVLPVKGQFTGKFCQGNREVEQEVFVVEKLRKPLLDRPAIQALELVVHVGTVQDEKPSLIEQFPTQGT